MENRQDIIIIAAVAENGVIGRGNALPWAVREDLRRFKELTTGFPCIMGRKTWESLPRRPLPNRVNIIISASMTEAPEGAKVFPSLPAAINFCAAYPSSLLRFAHKILKNRRLGGFLPCKLPSNQRFAQPDNRGFYGFFQRKKHKNLQAQQAARVFICGGASIYREALAYANKMELTVIHGHYEGDVFFPEIDPKIWKKTGALDSGICTFVSYNKISEGKI